MICPACGSTATHHVIDSRPASYGTRRRRQCCRCLRRFTSYETTTPPRAAAAEVRRVLRKIRAALDQMLGDDENPRDTRDDSGAGREE